MEALTEAASLATRIKIALPLFVLFGFLMKASAAATLYFQIVPELGQIKLILAQIGPTLSGVLFITAGIFYALGQVLPPEKKAQFHTTSVNIVIGAIVVGSLSIASTSLATASASLLSNLSTNSPS